jgi:hypothetical protein
MKRASSILVLAGSVVLVVACSPSTGGLGSVPTTSPTVVPSVLQGSPDLTPGATGSVPTPTRFPSAQPGGTPTAAATPVAPSAGTSVVRAYFFLRRDGGLLPVLREVPKTVQVATAAMNALLAGPTDVENDDRISNAVPKATQLLGLSIKDGVATVDLSGDFDGGGGAAAAEYRLGQVVYTLTQFPTITSVLFQIDGRNVTAFGSAGVALDRPVGRDDYVELLPAIFVDRPAYRAALGNPGRVTGNADVFEATFRIALIDGDGGTLVDQQVMATCGSGCRGTLDTTLRYTVAKAQWGTLRAYNPSAKDGTPEDIREYPVWLTPAN